ncbi:MAG: thioredoxin [Verrucomicrobiae bacterium]|nr:thioredoxin [Verrucomicrobiae bacterium]
MMKIRRITFAVACLALNHVAADTVTLKNGTQVEGAVTTFKNQKFEFESDKGARNTYLSSDLQRIDFKLEGEQNGVPAEVTHRTKGGLRGRVTEFADGSFKFVDAQGKEQALPLLMVTSASFAGGTIKDIEIITHGKRVDIVKKLAPGKVTLIDFYADWCGPCRMISPHLEAVATKDKDVVLRKVDIVQWGSEVCKQYGVNSVPQVWVYDKKGKLVGKVNGASSQQVDALVARARQ